MIAASLASIVKAAVADKRLYMPTRLGVAMP